MRPPLKPNHLHKPLPFIPTPTPFFASPLPLFHLAPLPKTSFRPVQPFMPHRKLPASLCVPPPPCAHTALACAPHHLLQVRMSVCLRLPAAAVLNPRFLTHCTSTAPATAWETPLDPLPPARFHQPPQKNDLCNRPAAARATLRRAAGPQTARTPPRPPAWRAVPSFPSSAIFSSSRFPHPTSMIHTDALKLQNFERARRQGRKRWEQASINRSGAGSRRARRSGAGTHLGSTNMVWGWGQQSGVSPRMACQAAASSRVAVSAAAALSAGSP